MTHIMLDIETMGSEADAAVISVGLCEFDPRTGEIGAKAEFHATFEAMQEIGRKFEPDTVRWWMQQEKAAQMALFPKDADDRAVVMCRKISRWLGDRASGNSLKIWAKDPTFDVSIMRSLFGDCVDPDGDPMVWPGMFWNEFSVRTMLLMGKALGIVDVKREGFAHGALNDAVHQAKQVMNVMGKVQRKRAGGL